MDAREFKRIRTKLKLDREQFGKLLDMGAVTVWRKETGKSKIRKFEAEAAQRLATAHGA